MSAPVTAEDEWPPTDLHREIEHARTKIAEYEASRATSDYTCSESDVFVRYGYLMGLIQSLVNAFDAERSREATQ